VGFLAESAPSVTTSAIKGEEETALDLSVAVYAIAAQAARMKPSQPATADLPEQERRLNK